MYTRLKLSLSRLSGKVRPRLRSLRLRVMGLVILALLPAFGMMVFTASESRSLAIEQTQQNAMRLTELAVANQRQLIDGARDILITLAQLPAIQTQDRAACVFFLSNVLMQHPLYANFGAADGNGSVYCMTLPQRVPFSIAEQDYFQQSMITRDFALSEYQISPTNSQAVITLSYPVVDDLGYPQGIVFASLDLRWLGPFMNASSLPEGSAFRVIDHNGVILVSYPNGEIEIGQMMPESSIVGLVVAQRVGLTQEHDINGVARLYAYAPLQAGANSDVYMIISIPTEAAFAISNRILQRNMLALVIGAVLALATAWLGTQFFFLRQVNSLVDTTQRLSAGDLSARTNWSPGQGELGQLARAFDEMATTLQHREQEQQWAQEQIRKQTERAEALARIAGSLNAKLELDSVLQEVCDETCRAMKVSAVAVVVYQKAEKDLFYLSGPDLQATIKTQMNISYRNRVDAASSQQDTLTRRIDLAAHPRLVPSHARRLLDARYMFCIDLVHEGSLIGRLNLFTGESSSMREDELTLLEGIANSAALAITNARLYTELRLQEQLRADLLHQVIGAQEDERMRISRELHDETSQSLTALLLGLDTINMAAKSDITRIEGHTRQLKSVTEDMLDNIHRLIADLRPSLLDDLGLVAAIEWYGQQRLKPFGTSFRLEQTLNGRLPRPVETALFRIVQEGITNIVRHADASAVVVRLNQEYDQVSLEICDDGVGFIPKQLDILESNGRGLGLRGIQERAAILGGTMNIDSAIGAGTVMHICFQTYQSERKE
jgi:signal transduction histidine kinase/HAMP domain-containing protein